jgi:hypothetical protein
MSLVLSFLFHLISSTEYHKDISMLTFAKYWFDDSKAIESLPYSAYDEADISKSIEFVQMFIDSYTANTSIADKLISLPFPILNLKELSHDECFIETFAVMKQLHEEIGESLESVGIVFKPSLTIYEFETQRFLGNCFSETSSSSSGSKLRKMSPVGDIFYRNEASELATILSKHPKESEEHRSLVSIFQRIETVVTALDTTGIFRASYGSLSTMEKAEQIDRLFLFIWDSLVLKYNALVINLLNNGSSTDIESLTEFSELGIHATNIVNDFFYIPKHGTKMSVFAKFYLSRYIKEFLRSLQILKAFLSDQSSYDTISMMFVRLVESNKGCLLPLLKTEINYQVVALQWMVLKYALRHLNSCNKLLSVDVDKAELYKKFGEIKDFGKFLPAFRVENFLKTERLEENQSKADQIRNFWLPLVADLLPEEKERVILAYRNLLAAIKS